jgi:hypothetical protein
MVGFHPAESLLRDIRTVWPAKSGEPDPAPPEDNCSTASLLERLRALEESPWLEHQLTARKLARMLRPFEVEPRTIRIGGATAKGYCWEHFQDAFCLYLEEKCVTCDTNQ